MSEEILIKAEHVSKKFCKDLNLGLWYGLQDLGASVFGSDQPRELRKKEFWAVDDISFEVKRGECLGLLGHNGAGKSTLLKVLTGLIAPDRGRVELHGRVNALIELTAGFNPILTGRENIFNNGAVLGLTEKEIRAKFDEIVAFSELEEFIDTPVQYYSSGMKVRLGFSVAAHTEPDVLILDEVLAVGDAGFKTKSLNKMKEIMQNAAVIFVSHSMPQISRVCDSVLFMRHGKEYYIGNNVHKGIEMYFEEFKGEKGTVLNNGAELSNFLINGINTYNGKEKVSVSYGDDIILEFDVKITDPKIKDYSINIDFIDKDLKLVNTYIGDIVHHYINTDQGEKVKIVFPKVNLVNGEYTISYMIYEKQELGGKNLCAYKSFTQIIIRGLETSTYSTTFTKANLYIQNNPIDRIQ
ncbi:ATP-binding cassette domain-containing protein [Cruoricaptor ignavus]|uniref:ATP-binding cassette domain-containing protein n=1 Tax=Cruoricaptor ignavus TaxID=1118202 RepID=A0A7M1T391_9FLAO|nr:ABC transporter ATP-binding protein [Cruoricaptor ignavus]QOR73382.1 ATP-binding cassette domain-containing protein [Cruoricaptor ignavus]